MADPLSVTPERVVEILCRTELGAAMWRAAANEALVEVYQQRVDELTAQRNGEVPDAMAAALSEDQRK